MDVGSIAGFAERRELLCLSTGLHKFLEKEILMRHRIDVLPTPTLKGSAPCLYFEGSANAVLRDSRNPTFGVIWGNVGYQMIASVVRDIQLERTFVVSCAHVVYINKKYV